MAQGCLKLGLANASKAPGLGWWGVLPVVPVVALSLVLDFPPLSLGGDGEDEDEDD